jgi:hypothetical protein
VFRDFAGILHNALDAGERKFIQPDSSTLTQDCALQQK